MYFKIKKIVEEALFPTVCVFCGRTPSWICPECLEALKFVDPKECPICRKATVNNRPCPKCRNQTKISKLDYLFEYKGEIKTLVKKMKYDRYFSIRYEFAYLINKWSRQKSFLTTKDDIIWTYAPSSPKTIKKRGFNQIEEILNILSKMSDIKAINLFRKSDAAKRQAVLGEEARKSLIKGSISIRNKTSIPKSCRKIIILDDLATTGATLNECCTMLAQKYPNIKTHCITITRPKLITSLI